MAADSFFNPKFKLLSSWLPSAKAGANRSLACLLMVCTFLLSCGQLVCQNAKPQFPAGLQLYFVNCGCMAMWCELSLGYV